MSVIDYRDKRVSILPIKDIKVGERARQEQGAIGELAESIRKLGLLSPIIVEDGVLLAGERRLRACSLLGWTTIPAIEASSLSPLERLEVELEENLKRKGFEWREEVRLTERINELRKAADPNLTLDKLADKIGVGVSQLKENLALSKAVREWPELLQEKDKASAYRKSVRLTERKLRGIVVSVGKAIGAPAGAPEDALRSRTFTTDDLTLINQDCLEGLKDIPDGSIDLVLTDYPFGVNLDRNSDLGKIWDMVYEDKPEHLLLTLLPQSAREIARVLKTGAHFYIFFPSVHHHAFFSELSKYLHVETVPLIWNKVGGGVSFKPFSTYIPNYEPIWYGWKGDTGRKLARPGQAVLTYPGLPSRKRAHPAEKPLELVRYLVEQSTVRGETVLDLFSGSASTLLACKELGRRGIAFEKERSWWEIGVERLSGGGENDVGKG